MTVDVPRKLDDTIGYLSDTPGNVADIWRFLATSGILSAVYQECLC